jgi:hypothetical protein
MLKEQARKYEEELRQIGAATVSKPPGHTASHTAIPLPVKVTSKSHREVNAADLMMLKEQARKYEEELRQMGAATVSNPPGHTASHTAIPLPVKVTSKSDRELNAADLMMLKEQARKYEEELRQIGAATVSKPPGHTAIPLPVKVMSKMILDRELTAAAQTATRFGYAEAAGVPVESVEISKDGQSKGSYSITVYVKDTATAAMVSNKLSDAAILESALTSVVLYRSPPKCVCVCARTQASTLTSPLFPAAGCASKIFAFSRAWRAADPPVSGCTAIFAAPFHCHSSSLS